MIKKLLDHAVRKDIHRANKKNIHREYLRALMPLPKIVYWSGYHKKKIILFIVANVVGWAYEWQRSLYRYVLSFQSPRRFISDNFTAQ